MRERERERERERNGGFFKSDEMKKSPSEIKTKLESVVSV